MPSFQTAALALILLVPAIAGAADGSVHLYLQPLPREAAGLTFTVESVVAVSTDGSELALDLRLKNAGSPDAQRQRLLASGRLPAGGYSGFLLKIGRATVKGESGHASAAVPDAPVRLDYPFSVGTRRAPAFWLTLHYQDSVRDGFSFSPVFSVTVPPRPIVDYAGFVTNSASQTITVFDTHVRQAVAVIDACAGPAGMALDQFRRRLYVACERDDEIVSIDVATLDVIERTRVSPGDRPRELALTADGRTLIAVNTGSNSISFFDAASLARDERVNVGSGPASIAIEPSGRRGFVFNTLAGSISVIDVEGHRLLGTLSSGSAPVRGQFNRRGTRLYVLHERSPYLTVVDPAQLSVVTRVRLKTAASAIRLDSVRDLVCIAGADAAIDFYDPNALMPLYSMRTVAPISHLTIDVQHSHLYMVSPARRSLVVGRLADRTALAEIDVGDGPSWVAVMGER